ncbi:lipoate--protein ligase family protein [Paenibacillus arenilitoris]|uniref:Lipoate--protein ligase family protein n=1 Tax=Paenibacillus arenilitoris TaxID=2772299 RepID=A0A927H7F5_9BACL|nr:lipoate--protein ligase family protein [Paenibacillus arenilitoris]MBD2871561.1 lipoate--protein ligase family protein [Paenibacillus arenilitoris]
MNEHIGKESGLADFYILDRTADEAERDVLYAFALDELLCRHTGQGGPAICHMWRHPKGFVMGLRDSRLPGAGEAQRRLKAAGWSTAVRNSGGAAVPLDPGVVNLSLIVPKPSVDSFHFHDDFERLYALVSLALKETGRKVDKGEIAGAYCPGEYDLSIDGRKFCGIAQRRQTHASIVQAFVVTEGAGADRTRLVRSFYEQAAAGEGPRDHPVVTDGSTASLEELTGLGPGAGRAFVKAVKRVLIPLQTEAELMAAEAKLALPREDEILEMAETLRARYAIEE